MLTEIQLSDKRLMKALRRKDRKHPLGYITRAKQYNENVMADYRKEYAQLVTALRPKPTQQNMWSKVTSFFRRNAK